MAYRAPPQISEKSKVDATPSPFFIQDSQINPSLWDTYTPYQLVLVKVVRGDSGFTYVPMDFRFTLPIPPQELQLDMPIPVNLQATLTGVSSQHGGAPFRNISLQGTTGIAQYRASGSSLAQTGIAESIFAGTVSAFQSLKNTWSGTQANGVQPNVMTGLSGDPLSTETLYRESTGYFQMRMMERFIEGYIQMKQTGGLGVDANLIRMAFCMWKDESVYLVEPIQFTKKRSVSSPMEYTFNLQLRAYRRVHLNSSDANWMAFDGKTAETFAGRNPSLLATIFNRFRKVTKLLSELKTLLSATLSDPINLMNEGLRQTSSFLAQVSGAKTVLTHLPETLRAATQGAIQANWNNVSSQFSSLISPDLNTAMGSGQHITSKQQAEFDSKLADVMSPSDVRLPPHLSALIAAELQHNRNLTRIDFENTRNLVRTVAADFSNRIGGGNTTYSNEFSIPAPLPTVHEPTDSEMDVLFALNEAAIQLDHLAVSRQINPPAPTSLEYVAGLAQRSGIAFTVPQSKFAVPFPYGSTLERLALTYLGDANRWHEIATLNGLREPYVDEVGFTLPLIVNGYQNTVTVADRSNLFQGQTVWIFSNGVQRQKRHIQHIKEITTTQYVLTLDGAPTLDVFKVLSSARLEAFLPATVNSQMSVYIPSQALAAKDPETKQIPGLDIFDPLLQVSGVDLLLTDSGDLAITPDGDCRLAYGLANIVQTVKLALGTPQGSLLQHPTYGMNVPVGTNTADINAEELLKAATTMFSNDPMFTGVRSATISKNGSVLTFTLDVGIAGTSQFMPISFNIG